MPESEDDDDELKNAIVASELEELGGESGYDAPRVGLWSRPDPPSPPDATPIGLPTESWPPAALTVPVWPPAALTWSRTVVTMIDR